MVTGQRDSKAVRTGRARLRNEQGSGSPALDRTRLVPRLRALVTKETFSHSRSLPVGPLMHSILCMARQQRIYTTSTGEGNARSACARTVQSCRQLVCRRVPVSEGPSENLVCITARKGPGLETRAQPFLRRPRIPSPFAEPGIVSLPSSKAVERSQRQSGSGLGSYEEEEEEEVRGCTPVPCVCCPASEFSRHFLYSSYFHIVRHLEIRTRTQEQASGSGKR